jgi:pyruvate kinase
MEDALKEIKKELLGLSLVNAGDFIIITSGLPLKVSGGTNSLRIIKI